MGIFDLMEDAIENPAPAGPGIRKCEPIVAPIVIRKPKPFFIQLVETKEDEEEALKEQME